MSGELASFWHSSEHLVGVAAESAVYSIVQEPLDGLEQLTNRLIKPVTGYELPHLQIVQHPEEAAPGSPERIAQAIGTGLGRAIDVMVLSAAIAPLGLGVTLGIGATGTAALTGLAYGLVFIPATNPNTNFWQERVGHGITWGLAAGAATFAAESLAGLFATETPVATFGSKVASSVIRGTTSGITKHVSYSVLGMEHLAAPVATERVMSGITTSLVSNLSVN